MFKVNSKDTGTPTYFTPCSSVFIVNSEHVIAGWVFSLHKERAVNSDITLGEN